MKAANHPTSRKAEVRLVYTGFKAAPFREVIGDAEPIDGKHQSPIRHFKPGIFALVVLCILCGLALASCEFSDLFGDELGNGRVGS